MTFPDHLGEGGLDPVKDIAVQRILYRQNEGASKELGGNISDGGVFPQVIQPIYKIGEEEAETFCPYSTGAIIRCGCRILSEGLQVLSLGGEPGEGGLEVGAGDSDKGIASSQVKGGNIDVQGRTFVWERP